MPSMPMDRPMPMDGPMPTKLPMAVEGSPALSPKFIKQLQITFGDKPMLSPRETRKVEDMIDKLSIENIKTLVSANIPHVSDIAMQYMKNNTPGGMKNYEDIDMNMDAEDKALEDYDNEPSEEYMDAADIVPNGTDLHRKKPAGAIRVKDPAVRSESIKERLWAALTEKKEKTSVSEISSDLAKRYTKNAKVDRDNTDHILKRDGSSNDWKTNQQLQKRNSKRTKGINRAAKRIDK
jgi:ribosomal protein S24E